MFLSIAVCLAVSLLYFLLLIEIPFETIMPLGKMMLIMTVISGSSALLSYLSESRRKSIENKLKELEGRASTIEAPTSGWYEYMVRASGHSQQDGDLWFRYLYKVIRDDVTKLSPEDVERLLQNPVLTPFQKVTLQDALTEGTHTREHVLQANRKSEPKDLLAILRNEKDPQNARDE